MADIGSSIFNRKATAKLRATEDLSKYVRVANPKGWVLALACLALLAGLLAWGLFGAVSTNLSTSGALVEISDADLGEISAGGASAIDNAEGKSELRALCFLSAEDLAQVQVGNAVNMAGSRLTVGSISPLPSSPDYWRKSLKNSSLVNALFTSDWAYAVFFEGDVSKLDVGVPLSTTITTERISPLEYMLGGLS